MTNVHREHWQQLQELLVSFYRIVRFQVPIVLAVSAEKQAMVEDEAGAAPLEHTHHAMLADLKLAPVTKPQNQSRQRKQHHKRRAKLWRKPKSMPKRPLSAYNLFFADERKRLLGSSLAEVEAMAAQGDGERRKPSSELGFAGLARAVAAAWKNLDPAIKAVYQCRSEEGRGRYKKEVKEWETKMSNVAASRCSSDSVQRGSISEVHAARSVSNSLPVQATQGPYSMANTAPWDQKEGPGSRESHYDLTPCYPTLTVGREPQLSAKIPAVHKETFAKLSPRVKETTSSSFPNYHNGSIVTTKDDTIPTNILTTAESQRDRLPTFCWQDDAVAPEDYPRRHETKPEISTSPHSCHWTENPRLDLDPMFQPLRIFPEGSAVPKVSGLPQLGRATSTRHIAQQLEMSLDELAFLRDFSF